MWLNVEELVDVGFAREIQIWNIVNFSIKQVLFKFLYLFDDILILSNITVPKFYFS